MYIYAYLFTYCTVLHYVSSGFSTTPQNKQKANAKQMQKKKKKTNDKPNITIKTTKLNRNVINH